MNLNKSCIEIALGRLQALDHDRWTLTRVVLKLIMAGPAATTNIPMNLNKSCIEIQQSLPKTELFLSMNLNKSCIEIAATQIVLHGVSWMNLNKSCIEILQNLLV